MTATEARSATFETTVTATGNNTGIVVPDALVDDLGAGKRPSVLVDVNGYQYRSTVGVMGGKHMISISAAIRKDTGLSAGDSIRVTLTLADSPRKADVPDDLAAALAADQQAAGFFAKLSHSMQRYHVDNINAAKSAETRQRRIEKAIALFRDGKQR
jgi:antitoxin component of MazEF toxin-antitoxin module